MADPPPYPGTPRWVKVFAAIVLIAGALFVTVHLTSGDFARFIDHGKSGSTSSPSVIHDAPQP